MRALSIIALLFALGCGGKKDSDAPLLPEVVGDLRDVGGMLASGNAGGRGPRSVGDIPNAPEMFPRGWKAIDTGAIVVFWQNPMMSDGAIAAGADASSAKAAACEKKAITEGGYVLLTNGSVIEMTADELAKKK